MGELTPKSVEEKLQLLKTIIKSDILQEYNKSGKISEFGDTLPVFLKKEEGTVRVKPWLKARLFEVTIASVGMDTYLTDLLNYAKDKPEDEVPINLPLASSLISASLNSFALELVNEMILKKTNILSKDQVEALSLVFRPDKDFSLPKKDIKFQSDQIQNVKNWILSKSLDILSAYKQDKYVDTLKVHKEAEKIPRDLKRVTYVPDFTIEQLFSISKKYRSQLTLSFVDGYLVWRFRNQPAIYMKEGEAYYSPMLSKRRGTTTIEQADRQVYHIMEQVETTRPPTTRCLICGNYSTNKLFFHLDKGVIPICEECSKDPKVVGLVSRLKTKPEG